MCRKRQNRTEYGCTVGQRVCTRMVGGRRGHELGPCGRRASLRVVPSRGHTHGGPTAGSVDRGSAKGGAGMQRGAAKQGDEEAAGDDRTLMVSLPFGRPIRCRLARRRRMLSVAFLLYAFSLVGGRRCHSAPLFAPLGARRWIGRCRGRLAEWQLRSHWITLASQPGSTVVARDCVHRGDIFRWSTSVQLCQCWTQQQSKHPHRRRRSERGVDIPDNDRLWARTRQTASSLPCWVASQQRPAKQGRSWSAVAATAMRTPLAATVRHHPSLDDRLC